MAIPQFWAFLLVFSRVTALFSTAPVFAARSAPMRVKAGLAGLISIALAPQLQGKMGQPPTEMINLIAQIASELTIGLCLGFVTQTLFGAFQAAGQYIDNQMGFGMINVLNPASEQQTSILGQFLSQVGITLFLILGGHLFLIGTLARSFDSIGPGSAHFTGNMMLVMSSIATQMFIIAIRLAAPAAAILLAIDVAFAIIARTMPQLNIMIVGAPVKGITGLMTVAVVLPGICIVVAWTVPIIANIMSSLLLAAR